MTPASMGSSSKRPLVITLAAIGVIAIIVGILWFTGHAPGFLNSGSHVHHGGHNFRGAAGVVVGLVLLAFAWIQNKRR